MCQTLCCQYYRARLRDVQSRIGLHRNWIPPTDSCGENLKKRLVVWVGDRVFLMFFSLSCVVQHLKWEHCVYARDIDTFHLSTRTFLNLLSPNAQVHHQNSDSSLACIVWLLEVYHYCSHSGTYEILDIHYGLWTLWSNEGAVEGSAVLKDFSFSCLSPLPCPQHNPVQAFASSLNPLCAAPEAKSASNSISLYYLQWGKIMELSVLAWIVSSWLVALKLCGNCRLKTKS